MKAKVDFFISYTRADLPWAQWIYSCLNEGGYSSIVQFAHFLAGQNIINEMHKALRSAEHVLGVLSENYLKSPYATAEWMAALLEDPLGEKRKLIFVKVDSCQLSGLLANVIYIDLAGLSEDEATAKLIRELRTHRPMTVGPEFPTNKTPISVYPPSFPPFWCVPTVRKPFFVGREQLMEILVKEFSKPGASRVVMLTGMGGTGKTRIALEYCYTQIAHYEIVWWIDASVERLIYEGFKKLATELGKNTEGRTNEDVLGSLKGFLSQKRSLVVLDNVSSTDAVIRIISELPTVHLLCTSRVAFWTEIDCVIKVPCLSRNDAIRFLIGKSKDSNEEAAAHLCQQLGDLPIALEQAALYIERTACGIRTYSERFEDRRRRGEPFKDDSEAVIAAVWQISFRRLLYEDPLSVWWLQSIAFLGPYPIPRRFFNFESRRIRLRLRFLLMGLVGFVRYLYSLTGDTTGLIKRNVAKAEYSLESSLQILQRYGLIEVSQESISLHPLMRQVLQASTKSRLRRRILDVCVDYLADAEYDTSQVSESSKLWCLHVLDIAARIEESGIEHEKLVKVLLTASELLAASSTEKQADGTRALELALRTATRLKQEPRQTWEIVCLLRLVADCREADRYSSGVLYLRRAIALLLASPKAPLTSLVIRALSEYGQMLLFNYETTYGAKFFEAAIAAERKTGSGEEMLSSLLAEYAELLRIAGEYDNAEAAAAEALQTARKVLGPNEVMIGRLQFNLGKIQSCKGDKQAARHNLETAFAIITQKFGENSPYLRDVRFELESLEHHDSRLSTARLFQTPRTEEDRLSVANVDRPYGEAFEMVYEEAREIALEQVRLLAVPALLRIGVVGVATNGEPKVFDFRGSEERLHEIGRILSPLVVPIYQAIENDARWVTDDLLGVFRDEILTQYSISFRSRMVLELGTEGLDKLPKGNPHFEDYVSCFEANLSNYIELVVSCLQRFEEGLLQGELRGTRRGIHGFSLGVDAPYY